MFLWKMENSVNVNFPDKSLTLVQNKICIWQKEIYVFIISHIYT